jgi:hypothetical protein
MKPLLRGTGLRRYTRKRLVHDRDAARAEVLRLEGVIRGLDAMVLEANAEIEQLRADVVDVGVERQLRADAVAHAAETERKYLALKAASDNEHAVTVPPMHRPADDPDETPTRPVPLWKAVLADA